MWRIVPLLMLLSRAAPAQLPPSGTLGDADRPLFQAEIERLQGLLATASEKAAVTYELASTQAAGKQWPEAIDWLRRAVAFNAGLDPSRDVNFTPLHGAREFEQILDAVRASTPPVSNSRPLFTVAEGDLVPESMAYDAAARQFYFGSMRKGKVLRCDPSGHCASFAEGLGTVLGLKVHRGSLWLLDNARNESALVRYDLASRRAEGRYATPGSGHAFNDLVVAPAGDVYLTDTARGAVWRLPPGAHQLNPLPGRFPRANGIALSADARLLYVSTFPDGIAVVDLRTGSTAPIDRPAGLSLAMIDGLYFHKGALIAIQNGYMTPRVVRFVLTPDLRGIRRLDVLERRNPLFDGVTTGVVGGGNFYFMANIQDNKKSGFDPIAILKLRL